MAKIKQIGVGRKSNGTIDGIVYVTIGGRTIARSLPNHPRAMFETPEARKRQTLFKLINICGKQHAWTIRRTFDKVKFGNTHNSFVKANYAPLCEAFAELAQRSLNGDMVTAADIEDALTAYATSHPTSVLIANKSGYDPVYLTGEWPQTITLTSGTGKNSIVITCFPDGSTTTETPGTSGGSTPGQNDGPSGGGGL